MQLITIPLRDALLVAFGGTLCLCSGLVYYAMIGRVNRYLPDEEQINYLFRPRRAEFSKPLRLIREHRRLYPKSRLPLICILLEVVAIALIGIVVLTIPV